MAIKHFLHKKSALLARALVLVALCLSISACGNKGALYIPETAAKPTPKTDTPGNTPEQLNTDK